MVMDVQHYNNWAKFMGKKPIPDSENNPVRAETAELPRSKGPKLIPSLQDPKNVKDNLNKRLNPKVRLI